jgi:RecA-family ATPase
MRWVSRVGDDNSLMKFDKDGAFTTPLYDQVKAAAIKHGARLLIVDTAADVFSGNENDRHQVRRFIGQLNALAIAIEGAVLLDAHPSRTGLSTGNLDGGSTAWSNTVRSRWSLARPEAEEGEPDTDARILTRRKANYCRIGDDISLRWVNGTLMPPVAAAGGAGAPYRAAAETVFLELLAARWAQNVFVSHSSRAGNYAPKLFARMADRKGYTAKDFEAAMNRLLDARRIIAEPYGRRGDERQRISLVNEPEP